MRQLSLDVEQFCDETAQALCNEDNKQYSCCSDYNVEIVDVRRGAGGGVSEDWD